MARSFVADALEEARRRITQLDAARRRTPDMTQAMIEAGIRAYGADDGRCTPERVLDIWQAMNDAAQPPRQEYEAPRDPAHQLKVRAVGRIADEPRAFLVAMTERPTDDEIRSFHDHARDWRFGVQHAIRGTRWRHCRRGTEYDVLVSTAEAQCATGPINEGDHVTVYVDDKGGWWVRKTNEFQDGRFERQAD